MFLKLKWAVMSKHSEKMGLKLKTSEPIIRQVNFSMKENIIKNRTDLFIMEMECRLDDPLGYDWNELVLDCVGQGNGKPFMNLPLLIA